MAEPRRRLADAPTRPAAERQLRRYSGQPPDEQSSVRYRRPPTLAGQTRATATGDEQTISDPKLIIEVLCPGTKGYDKRDKFILYRTLGSLREYVLIDPVKRQVEVFTLADAGAWLLIDQTTAVELTLTSIACKLPMDLVFKGVAVASK